MLKMMITEHDNWSQHLAEAATMLWHTRDGYEKR